ncbi:MAG: hypothetical protein CXT78_08090 [Thaumarchaeota archaeon]|jgi:peptidoglycan/xylan/chitin deacetylase (PgdA/CDA1 family)|nr:MAG: hypothetical protein CXT78_08090 [Nitrososphaerota archaeon]
MISLSSQKSIITTSWDDGHPLDFKIGNILEKNNIPGTFYIPLAMPGKELMSKDKMKILSKKFEIGGHTLTHPTLTELSLEDIEKEVNVGKDELEKIVGEISSFCYPRGQYNSQIIKIVKKSGFNGARTAEFLRYTIKNLFEYHPTVHAYDRILASRGKQTVTTEDKDLSLSLLFSGTIFKTWDHIAKKTLDFVLEHGGIWHLWGHSWEIDDNNDWHRLTDVLEYAKHQGKEHGAEFLTNSEIFKKFS